MVGACNLNLINYFRSFFLDLYSPALVYYSAPGALQFKTPWLGFCSLMGEPV